ncbi:hypothetical protein HRG_014169 [Hirsutella rhossiliensis]
MDVEGAFDTVLRSRLILRLRQQGWPRNVARSPASPILFLLYTEPIYRLSNPKGASAMQTTLPSFASETPWRRLPTERRNMFTNS